MIVWICWGCDNDAKYITALTSGLPWAKNEAEMAKLPTRRRVAFLLKIMVAVFLMEDVLKKICSRVLYKAKFNIFLLY